jgi:plasmid stabilization system protein ParE
MDGQHVYRQPIACACMPQIVLIPTESAIKNIEQIRVFYSDIPDVGKRAIEAISKNLRRLTSLPNIGKPNPEDDGATRLLSIDFGASGYVVKYRYLETEQKILILGIRNFRQAGFY